MNEFVIPNNLKNTLDLINDKEFIIFAGGTDLMVRYRFEKPEKPFIFIGDLDELKFIKKRNSILRIGSCIKFSELLCSKETPKVFKEILKKIGSPSIRNMGTIGGNICNASPAADTLPFLYAMNCEVLIISKSTKKVIPIFDFIIGPKKTILKSNEILKEIRFKNEKFDKYYFRKVGLRNANSLSKVSVFCAVKVSRKEIEDIRIAIGAVSPVVVRNRKVEERIIGLRKDDLKNIKGKILKAYSESIHPIDDQRSTAEYRKETVIRLIDDFLESVVKY